MKKLIVTIVVPWCFLLAISIIWNSITFLTMENEYTVVKQFGQIKSIHSEPGLSFKIPIKENVRKTTRYLITPLSKLFTHRKQ